MIKIKGSRVYSKLKYEDGVPRVQCVPLTEIQDSVHTSPATFAIMPEIDLHGIRLLDPTTSRTLRTYLLENVTKCEVLDSYILHFGRKIRWTWNLDVSC